MRRTITAAALLAVASVVVAGCGGSSSGGSPSSSSQNSAAASSSPTLSGTPIKLMQITEATSAGGFAGFPDAINGAKSAVAAVNAAGGVNGHPLQLTVCNDAFDPNKATACGRQAVSGGYAAVVGAYSGVSGNWMPPLTAAGIACLGCAGYSAAESTSVDFFPLGAAGTPVVIGDGGFTCAVGAKKPAIVYVNHSSGTFLAQAYDAGLKPCGVKAKEVGIDQTAADFAPQAAQALSGGTDFIDTVIGHPDIEKFEKDVVEAGGKVPFLDSYENLQPSTFNSVAQKGSYVATYVVPWQIKTAGTDLYNGEIAKYGESGVQKTEASEVAWTSVHVFANVAKTMTGTITPKAFVTALKGAGTIQYGPMAPAGVNFAKPIAAFAPVKVYSPFVYVAKVGANADSLTPTVQANGGFFASGTVPTLIK